MVSFFLSRQPILTPDRPTDREATGRRATGGGRREPAAAERPTFSLPSTKFPGSRARRRYERPAIPLGKRSKNKDGRGWSSLRRHGFRAMGLNSIISPPPPPFLSRCSSGSSTLFCRNALWRTPFRALLLVMMWLKYEALENSRLSPTQCGFPGQVLATVRGSEVWLFKCKRARWRERELERLSTRKNGGTPREHNRIPRTERDKTKK